MPELSIYTTSIPNCSDQPITRCEPRCFAVMFFKPADRIAPAPRTTWHVRELKAYI